MHSLNVCRAKKVSFTFLKWPNERIAAVSDICAPGDAMRVKCIDIDNQGRVRLSRKAALNDEAAE